MFIFRRFLVTLSFAVGALALSGCGGSTTSRAVSATKKATVTIYHTLVTNGGETGPIDVIINRKAEGSGIVYLGAAPDRTLEWTPPGGDQYVTLTRSGDATAKLLQTALLFDPNETYSLFVVGEANAPDAARRPSIVVLPRDTGGIASGRFRVRFVHTLADAGAVDVYLGDEGDRVKLVANLPFREGTSYGDIPVSALPLRVTVTPAGTDPDPDPTANLISIVLTAADYKAGKTYTEALVHRNGDAASRPTILNALER